MFNSIFQQVNKDELREIVDRVQRPTLTSSLQCEMWKTPPKRNCATPMPKQVDLEELEGVQSTYASHGAHKK